MLLQLLDKYSYIWRKDEWKRRNNFNGCSSSTWRHFKATLKPKLAENELCQSHYPSCGKRRDWKVASCWEVCFMRKEQQLTSINFQLTIWGPSQTAELWQHPDVASLQSMKGNDPHPRVRVAFFSHLHNWHLYQLQRPPICFESFLFLKYRKCKIELFQHKVLQCKFKAKVWVTFTPLGRFPISLPKGLSPEPPVAVSAVPVSSSRSIALSGNRLCCSGPCSAPYLPKLISELLHSPLWTCPGSLDVVLTLTSVLSWTSDNSHDQGCAQWFGLPVDPDDLPQCGSACLNGIRWRSTLPSQTPAQAAGWRHLHLNTCVMNKTSPSCVLKKNCKK